MKDVYLFLIEILSQKKIFQIEERAIVIDNGTGTIKAGFCQDEALRSVFRVWREAKKNNDVII